MTRYRSKSSRSFHGFQLWLLTWLLTATSGLRNVLVCDVEVCRCQVPGSAISNHWAWAAQHQHEGQQWNLPARCPPYQLHTQLGSVWAATHINQEYLVVSRYLLKLQTNPHVICHATILLRILKVQIFFCEDILLDLLAVHGADRWYRGWYQHCAERGPWRPRLSRWIMFVWCPRQSAWHRGYIPTWRTMEIEIAWIYYNQTDQRSQHRVRTSWDLA